MNTHMHIMVLVLSVVCMPTSTDCMGLKNKKPKDSLMLPKIGTHKKLTKFQALRAALSRKSKQKTVSASLTPITSSGFVASHTPTKTPDALSQVRRNPSSRPPVLLQSLQSLTVAPLSPTSPPDLLPSPAPSATSSSGRSELSALSSPSSASTASPLPSPSPDMESILLQPHDVSVMLQAASPEMAPIVVSERDSSPHDFSLPAPALVTQKEDQSPASAHVNVGSLGDVAAIASPRAAGSMRVDWGLEDEDQHHERVTLVDTQEYLEIIDIRALSKEDVWIITSLFGETDRVEDIIKFYDDAQRQLRAFDVSKIASSDDTWTPLMQAAHTGDIDAIRSMEFTFKDVKEWHGGKQPDQPKTYAFKLAQEGYNKRVVGCREILRLFGRKALIDERNIEP